MKQIDWKNFIKTKKFYEIIFCGVLLLSFGIWLFLLMKEGNASRQFDIFFRRCADFFADTLNVVGYSGQRDVYHNMNYTGLGEKAYPPLTYVGTYLLSRLVNMEPYYQANYFLDMYKEPQFFIVVILFLIINMILLYEVVRTCKKGTEGVKIVTAFAVLLSAPGIYSMERGNTILLTVFFVMLFVFYHDSEKAWLKELALIAFAFSIGLKITPAVLGVLLLYKKQWKEIGRAVIYTLIVVFVPFLFFKGGFDNIAQMFSNIQSNLSNYTSVEGCTLTASIFQFTGVKEDAAGAIGVLTYLICAVILVGSFFFREKWKKILAVSLILVILPSHSGYYCILYLIPAMIAFLNEEKHSYDELIILLTFLFIMIDVQSDTIQNAVNYHLSILIMTLYLVIQSGSIITKKIMSKNGGN